MSALTINNLPPELITEILRRIEQSAPARTNAMLTCKLWKELIERSSSWFLIFRPTTFNEARINFFLATNRIFHIIEMHYFEDLGKYNLIEIFKRLGRNVIELRAYNCHLDKCHDLVEILKYLPNMEHFIAHDTSTKWDVSDIPSDYQLAHLSKLKTFNFIGKDANIIKCFETSQLKKIDIFIMSGRLIATEIQPAIDLIRSQQELTTLSLGSFYLPLPPDPSSALFRTDILGRAMSFHLSRLSLQSFQLQNGNDYRNMLKLMQHHTATLTELYLGRTFPNFVYEFVFAKFKNLKSLELQVGRLPNDMTLEENRNISNLTLSDLPLANQGFPDSLKNLIMHLPNVTDLTLSVPGTNEIMSFLANNLAKVNTLNILSSTDASMFNGVQFPKLTSMSINWLHGEIDWDRFTNENSTITELTIRSVMNKSLDSKAIDKITKNLKLRKLKIGSGLCGDTNFYNIIRKNYLNLKMLELHMSMTIEDDFSGLGDVPGLRFVSSW